MGLLSTLRNIFTPEKRGSIENPASPMVAPVILTASGYNINTPFGIITPSVALTLSTVFACCRALAETVASMDLHVYQLTADGKRKAIEHPLYHLLSSEPNAFMSSYIWREQMIYNRLLMGNSFSGIIRDGGGRPMELRPLRSDQVQVAILEGHKVYKFNGDYYPDTDFIHIPNVTFDGITAMSTITFARTSISLGLAAEQYGARMFSQGTSADKWIKVPGTLTEDQYKRMRESWSGNYSGMTNAFKVPIMENNAELNTLAVQSDDMQFLQTREFNVIDICRWFRVPPHKAGDLSKATNNNVEQQSIEWVTDSIHPVAALIEAELTRKLLLPSERGQYVIRFDLNSLLRGDLDSRYKAYATGRQWGWLSSDDVRSAEDMNKLPDGQGAIYLNPMNMVPALQMLTAIPAASQPAKDATANDDSALGGFNSDDRSRKMLDGLSITLTDAMVRMNYKASEAIKRAAAKPGSFDQTARDFFGKHEQTLASAIEPSLQSLAVAMTSVGQADKAREMSRMFAADMARKVCHKQLADVAANPATPSIEPLSNEQARVKTCEPSPKGYL